MLAILAISPALLHAQAPTPAQTASPAVLQARIDTPRAELKSAAKGASATTPSGLRISTGVVGPKLIQSVNFNQLDGLHSRVVANEVTVVVTMTVDENGKPGNVSIAKSGGEAIDQDVLAAVGQYRFRPGTLDGQPFALPVRLAIVVERGAQY